MPSIAERLDSKVDRTGEHHVWTGAKKRDGTGQVRVNGKLMTAQRLAWEVANGPLPPGARVRGCPEEPACVRLQHLSLMGSTSSNRRSRAARGSGSKREL